MGTGEIRTILIADDNADAAESLASILAALGIQTVVTRNGAEALMAAKERMPDAAILDIGMPELNGWEVCRRIRGLPGGDRPMLVALTGWGSQEDMRKSHEAGFNAHWTKPAEPTAVFALVGKFPHDPS